MSCRGRSSRSHHRDDITETVEKLEPPCAAWLQIGVPRWYRALVRLAPPGERFTAVRDGSRCRESSRSLRPAKTLLGSSSNSSRHDSSNDTRTRPPRDPTRAAVVSQQRCPSDQLTGSDRLIRSAARSHWRARPSLSSSVRSMSRRHGLATAVWVPLRPSCSGLVSPCLAFAAAQFEGLVTTHLSFPMV